MMEETIAGVSLAVIAGIIVVIVGLLICAAASGIRGWWEDRRK